MQSRTGIRIRGERQHYLYLTRLGVGLKECANGLIIHVASNSRWTAASVYISRHFIKCRALKYFTMVGIYVTTDKKSG